MPLLPGDNAGGIYYPAASAFRWSVGWVVTITIFAAASGLVMVWLVEKGGAKPALPEAGRTAPAEYTNEE